jgi:hypothetical protein
MRCIAPAPTGKHTRAQRNGLQAGSEAVGFTAAQLLERQNPVHYLRPSELEQWMLEAGLATLGPGRRLRLTERGQQLGDQLAGR